jgi:hypothetical protein
MNNQTTEITVASLDYPSLEKASQVIKAYFEGAAYEVKGPMKIRARYIQYRNGNVKESRIRLIVKGLVGVEMIKGMETLPISKNCNFSFSVENDGE